MMTTMRVRKTKRAGLSLMPLFSPQSLSRSGDSAHKLRTILLRLNPFSLFAAQVTSWSASCPDAINFVRFRLVVFGGFVAHAVTLALAREFSETVTAWATEA
jgi:hypothetical protein